MYNDPDRYLIDEWASIVMWHDYRWGVAAAVMREIELWSRTDYEWAVY